MEDIKMKPCINGATTMPYTFEQDINSAGDAGFEGVEIWSAKLNKFLETHSVEAAKALLDKNNLQAAALCPWSFCFFGDIEGTAEAISRGAKLAQQLGSDTLLVCPDAPPSGISEAEAVKVAGTVGRRYAKICQNYGVNLALEPLGNHPFVPGPKQALAIVEAANHDNFGMMMDTFHYYKSGVPMEDIAAIPIEKLFIVHVNDCDNRPRNELNDSHRLYTGLGIIPLEEMLGILKRKGYQRFLSVEVFRQEYWNKPPEFISKEAKQHLDEVLAKII
ncbi:sugar phosphate isomerase/epimerase [Candidatus Poribacteria bacterium]|nr:sugar phosphate isomerase/epimerase [Candidatus Poribacteria bacterium]